MQNNQQTVEIADTANPEISNDIKIVEKKKNNPDKNSSLLILFGILLIILSVFSTFLFIQNQKLKKSVVNATPTPLTTTTPTPTTDPKSDWKTYSDPNGLYEFKYPQDFEESAYIEGVYEGVSVLYQGPDQGRKESMLADGLIVKTLVIHDTKLTAQEYATQMRSKELNVPEGDTQPKVSDIQAKTLAGKTTYFYSTDGLGNSKVYWMDINGQLLEIIVIYAGTEDKVSEYLQKADEILATFKVNN